MGKFRMIQIQFWEDDKVSEEMTPEDKYFFLYLLTNPKTTSIGIYPLTKKRMAFETGYSVESIHALMERFEKQYQLIRYNPQTKEVAIKNWGKYNFKRGGKPVLDCVKGELSRVKDQSLIAYVGKHITSKAIKALYDGYTGASVNDEIVPQMNKASDGSQKQSEAEREALEGIIKEACQNGFTAHPNFGQGEMLDFVEELSLMNKQKMLKQAFLIANRQNKKRLQYVAGILKNWAAEPHWHRHEGGREQDESFAPGINFNPEVDRF